MLTRAFRRARGALVWLWQSSKNSQTWALFAIMALGAYLRLWQIEHLFNIEYDSDEGVYSLAARFIAQGYLPYRDFLDVHPPLYNLVLASVYKIFGYSFFAGRYFSVALSLGSIILIYITGKKLSHPAAGLAAAALFAVSTHMVFVGRRVVQEPLAIFLLLLAIYFAIDYLTSNRRNRLLFCGVALGLAAATKYTSIPAVVAIMAAISVSTLGEGYWQSLKTLGRPKLWVAYLATAAILWLLLFLLRESIKLDVPIPFREPVFWSARGVAATLLVFVLPFVISLLLVRRGSLLKECCISLWEMRHKRELWVPFAATVLGFVAVIGFFWVKAPQEFLLQTVIFHQNRPAAEFPSLIGIIRRFPSFPILDKMLHLPIVFPIPLVFILLNKQRLSRSDCFLAVALIVSVVLCQRFSPVPRHYYASIFPLLILGFSILMPALNTGMFSAKLMTFTTSFKIRLLVLLVLFLGFTAVTTVLLATYIHYQIYEGKLVSYEERVYRETIDYLEAAGAKKVYAVHSLFMALSPNLGSTRAFDTFGELCLERKPPELIVRDAIEEGVDYMVIEPLVQFIYPSDCPIVGLFQEVHRNGRLVKVIPADSRPGVTIYLMGAAK